MERAREAAPEREELESVRKQLKEEKAWSKELWTLSCKRTADQEELLEQKDKQIVRLQTRVASLSSATKTSEPVVRSEPVVHPSSLLVPETVVPPPSRRTASTLLQEMSFEESVPTTEATGVPKTGEETTTSKRMNRKGKAPPIDPYTGEDPEVRFEDWLPTLNGAASWNGWSEEEKLLQLAGYLRGRALQEWDLLDDADCKIWAKATDALKARLDQGTKVLAAQDFRHTTQRESETVTDFIRRLERTFRIAYGREIMGKETREALLYGQLQEGLRQEFMRSPAVYGATSYPELLMAAKNEEQRQNELRKRKQYQTSVTPKTIKHFGKEETPKSKMSSEVGKAITNQPRAGKGPCHTCGEMGHFAKYCRAKKSESKGDKAKTQQKSNTRQIVSKKQETVSSGPLACLYSDSEEEERVDLLRVPDRGSCSRHAAVEVQGVLAIGTIDSGSDLTIINGDLFKKVAGAARSKKRDFKPTDKRPRTYSGEQFELDGRMDLDVSFDGLTMSTPVYIKMKVTEPLLLSEGVCSQLKILSYHPQVETPLRRAKEQSRAAETVPMVRIQLVKSSKLLPQSSHQVPVRLLIMEPLPKGPLLVEGDTDWSQDGIVVQEKLLNHGEGEDLLVTISNHSGFTMTMGKDTVIGHLWRLCLNPEVRFDRLNSQRPRARLGGRERCVTCLLELWPSQVKTKSIS